ncbi:MAG TPA: GNAT family N-acetyltransferase [Arenimonas sp.]|uniref:GNAT family N-acetyltransferase n=1 Tax=Arenimonas sp. TaxID=1872635 RepID=UPI002B9432E3|nr:GNAT family N-acetyltransferase [Arenimonas sp.]HMB56320.1 GNAT family N-acetyltransferase [Arenimonas sp.]
MNTLDIPDFRVEPADYTADIDDLRAIREPVFVVEQNVPIEMEWDELDPLCHHVIARDSEHRPIGTGRLTPEHKIGRMAVLREWRGKGVGDALLQALIEQARDLGWSEVSLNAQVDAIGFYAKFGFVEYDARFEEAGIQHQAMKLALPPREPLQRHTAAARGPSQKAIEFDHVDAAIEATCRVIVEARRGLVAYTRDLEHALYAQPAVVDAFKQFAVSGRGGVARILVQDPVLAQRQPHPLLALAQRLPTAFQFRTPVDPEDLQYASVYLASDHDGYLFRLLGSRFEGDWSPALPARSRQLNEHFGRVWERCRPCTEFRALGL